MSDDLYAQLQRSLGTAYALERELAGGGMSRVFLAAEHALGREVVVKVLAPELVAAPGLERFRREVLLTARLSHPNLVPVLSAGTIDEGAPGSDHTPGGPAARRALPYYIMPYVRGESLRERLARTGPLPVAAAVPVLADVARGLAYAHRHGVVHRDVKPENVLVTEDGVAVVTDFGIAKAIAAARTGGTGVPAAAPTLTGTGVVAGTPGYVAPEQITGEAVDHRADLYAWGVTAYELLAGRHPFAHCTSAAALLAAQVSATPPPLAALRPDVPPPLAALVTRCLAREPSGRPTSAAEVLAALVGAGEGGVARRPRTRRAGAGAAIAVALGASLYLAAQRDGSSAEAARVTSVAVLPFENVGGDTADAYFAEGMADELTTALAKVPGLRVAGRSSAARFRGSDVDVREVGRALSVGAVLEGTVRREGNRLRVSAQLTGARDGLVIWRETYERERRDVFAVQDDITAAIAGTLRLVAAGDTTGRGARPSRAGRATPDLEAYDLYLRGRYFWNRRTEDGLRRAVELLAAAIARDSTFALAHAALADAYSLLGIYMIVPSADALPRAREAARAALRLDPTLPEAHAALGLVHHWHERDWPAAEHAFRRAIALNPSYATAHHWYALQLSDLGRHDEAIAEMGRALALDPFSAVVGTIHGTRYLFAGRRAEALRQLTLTRELHPTYPLALFWLGQTHDHLGNRAAALAAAREAVRLDSLNPIMHLGLARLHATGGRDAEARRIAASVRERFAGRFSPVHMAWVHVALGEHDEAVRWLERAYEAHDGWLNNLAVDPALRPVLPHPGAQALLRRLGLEGAVAGRPVVARPDA